MFSDAKEAAFSNYRLWESLGFIAAYLLTSFSCLWVTTWIALGVLVAGMTGYGIIEMKLRRGHRTDIGAGLGEKSNPDQVEQSEPVAAGIESTTGPGDEEKEKNAIPTL